MSDPSASHEALSAGLRSLDTPAAELALQTATGAALWVEARVGAIESDRLWTLRDTTAQHALAARAQHLCELLDMAQASGRLGVWERVIPSGAGRWDRHVFGFWGISPKGGRPDRMIGIMIDDTEVHELARSRDNTAADLKLATGLADLVIWRHDLKTDRVHYNDDGFAVLGIPYRPGGRSIAEARAHTHPDDVHKLAASSGHALATGVPIDVEVRHQRSDGTWRYVLVRRVIERDAQGAVIAFVGVTVDVTEQVEQHAPRVAQTTRAFLNHEIRAFEIAFRVRLRDGRVRWMVLHADIDRSGIDSTRAFCMAMDVTERHDALDALHAATDRGGPALWDEQMWRFRGLAPRPVSLNREERLALDRAER